MALRFAHKIPSLWNNVVWRTSSAATGTTRHQTPAQVCQGLALGLKGQAHVEQPSGAPKTRYPLNQQDANTYIKQLKERALGAAQQTTTGGGAGGNGYSAAETTTPPPKVRSFSVDVHTRPLAGASAGCTVDGCHSRGMSHKAGGHDKCKPKKTNECKKMPEPECKAFKIENCKQTKNFDCTKRKYNFKVCKKAQSPYPSFSEACYEPLDPAIHECKHCPWGPEHHPTFKHKRPIKPMTKKQQQKKFHMDARRCLTLRYGEEDTREADRRAKELEMAEKEQEHQQQYAALNSALFEQSPGQPPLVALHKPKVQRLAPLPREDRALDLLRLKVLSQRVAPANPHVRQMLAMGHKPTKPRNQIGDPRKHKMKKPPKKHECDRNPACRKLPFKPPPEYDIKKKLREQKERNKKTGGSSSCGMICATVRTEEMVCGGGGATPEALPTGMLCKMKKIKNPDKSGKLACEELDASPVCPKHSLLDRKPYPKYRKAMKRRLKREKKLEKKRRAAREAKRKKPKKTCASVGMEDGGMMAPAPSWQQQHQQQQPWLEHDARILDMLYQTPYMRFSLLLNKNQPRPVRANNFYRHQRTVAMNTCPRVLTCPRKQVAKFEFKPLPENQVTQSVTYLSEEMERQQELAEMRMERECLTNTIDTLEKMILAKDRVRVTGPPLCKPSDCNRKFKKKDCSKKIKSRVCPTDLLDRKPYKKAKQGKMGKKGKKKHGRKHKKHRRPRKNNHERGKQAAGINEEEMTAMIMEADMAKNMTARTT